MLTKDLPNEANLSQTVLKALDILECVADADRPISAATAAKRCDVSRPTAYRLLSTLVARGYVAPVEGAAYRLGTQALSLSKKVLDSIDLPELAKPHMRHLSNVTNETVHLSILDNEEILYIAKVESSHSVRMASTIGTRNSLHCTAMGKAILAFLPRSDQSKLIEQLKLTGCTPAAIKDRAVLVEELVRVRTQKFALDNEESEEGVRCVGAPIFDHTGRAFAAISVSGPAYRLSVTRLNALSSLVIDAAGTISGALGYVSPPVGPDEE
jgi:IclR family KDG regulon transcriptional repressor